MVAADWGVDRLGRGGGLDKSSPDFRRGIAGEPRAGVVPLCRPGTISQSGASFPLLQAGLPVARDS
jgi:hypothetical protein